MCSTDAFGILRPRLLVEVVKSAWRPEALAHTAIHDDPRVVKYVAETVANLTRAG